MKKYKHIGWTKYCTTSTSMSKPGENIVEPWPCKTVFFKEKPELNYNESPEQFFWKKTYIKVTHGSNN